jgi:mono/diheme cytochrome c family protein
MARGLTVIASILTVVLVVGAGAARQKYHPGQDYLLRRMYSAPYLTESEFDKLWTTWEPAWRDRAADKSVAEVRRLAAERYGFPPSIDPSSAFSLVFVRTPRGLAFNCMSCHGGRLPGSGETVIGLPNNDVDIQAFEEDLGKLRGKPGAAYWGSTRGRTDAFTISHALLMYRDLEMEVSQTPVDLGEPHPYDLDAPPWWNLRRKSSLYSDGFVRGGGERAIMQFTMAGIDGPALRGFETDFKQVLDYIRSIRPPRYSKPIDSALAAKGGAVFEKTCSGCHGTYGPDGKYPERTIPIDVVGTDDKRLRWMTEGFRSYYAKSWLGRNSNVTTQPVGYVAPPLDGIWATAPYFHNGSVPTLYGVLTRSARPESWRRSGGPADYDWSGVGLQIETKVEDTGSALDRRRIVDTRKPGLGNHGHPFGFALSEQDKRAVIEYLKTL